jgi:hypothetical protein
MSTQLPLPAEWAQVESRRDPREHLTQLNRDMAATKVAIRSILQQVADRHGISPRDVTYAMDGYADNLLGDLVYNLERELEHEIEKEDPV